MPAKRRNLKVLLGLGLACGALAIFYVHYFVSRPIGTGPAGPSIASEPFAASWSQRKIRVVGIGDSITAGLGAKSRDHTFFNRILENPIDEFKDMEGKCLSTLFPNLESENLALSGSTSIQHASIIADKLREAPPDVFGLVLMTSGGNDLIHSYGRMPPREGAMYGATLEEATPWIENFQKRLSDMLITIQSRFPGGCEIYIGNIYDPTDGVGDAASIYLPRWNDGIAIHARYNQAILQAARIHTHVHVVPLYESFLGHGSHCRQFWRTHYDRKDPTYWFFDNIEDPNDRGYDAIRRVFLREILTHSRLREPR